MVLSRSMMMVNDKVINTLLLTLSVRERDSLLFRFWDGYTFKRIGEEFGVTKSAAEVIVKKTIRKLRNPTRINYLRFHGYIKLEGRFPWECDLDDKELLERLKVLEEKPKKNYPKKLYLPTYRPWKNFK